MLNEVHDIVVRACALVVCVCRVRAQGPDFQKILGQT